MVENHLLKRVLSQPSSPSLEQLFRCVPTHSFSSPCVTWSPRSLVFFVILFLFLPFCAPTFCCVQPRIKIIFNTGIPSTDTQTQLLRRSAPSLLRDAFFSFFLYCTHKYTPHTTNTSDYTPCREYLSDHGPSDTVHDQNTIPNQCPTRTIYYLFFSLSLFYSSLWPCIL